MPAKKEYPVKIRKIPVVDKKTGITYFEIRRTRYDPVRKYEVTLSSERTGEKVDPESGELVACRPKRGTKREQRVSAQAAPGETKPLDAMKANGRRGAGKPRLQAEPVLKGTSDILAMVGERSGLDDAIRAVYPRDIARQAISLVRYQVASDGSAIGGIEAWEYTHDLPYEGMSEEVCFELFETLGSDSPARDRLFDLLCLAGGAERPVIFDSTVLRSRTQGWDSSTGEDGGEAGAYDAFRMLSGFSTDAGLPVMMDLDLGRDPLIASALNAVRGCKVSGAGKPELVLGEGFDARNAVAALMKAGADFTMCASLDDPWVCGLIDEASPEGRLARGRLEAMSSCSPHDARLHAASVTLPADFALEESEAEGEGEMPEFCVHFYRDESRAAVQKEGFAARLHAVKRRLEDGVRPEDLGPFERRLCEAFMTVAPKRGRGKATAVFNDDACRREMSNFGIFVLISSCRRDPWAALRLHRRRIDIEKSYPMTMSARDGERTRFWTLTHVQGRELCRLLAFGCRFHLERALTRARENARRLAQEAPESERGEWAGASDWLQKTSLRQCLGCFDCVERARAGQPLAGARRFEESGARDRRVLELLAHALTETSTDMPEALSRGA